MCPLCLEWFLLLPRQQDCILEYILPTKSKRAIDNQSLTTGFSMKGKYIRIFLLLSAS
ncbi:hypothetical protein D3800_18615 [Microcystis aeruginosa NIES-298]|nr:hypothetical protein D3800_18615 [Microcystis aeruginosa NIES-298]